MDSKLKEYSALFLPLSILLSVLVLSGSFIYITKGGLPFVSGLSAGSQPRTEAQSAPNAKQEIVNIPVTTQDHIRGDLSAPVKIVEFSDLQCPFCQRFHPTVKQALEEYKGKVAWVYKHFPLTSIHSEAEGAAEASECVAAQKGEDGFWKFVDGVFAKQDDMGSALYRDLARSIGVNVSAFDSCAAQRVYKDKVKADADLAAQSGVRATPSSFVNGRFVEGAVPYEALKAAIEDALANIK